MLEVDYKEQKDWIKPPMWLEMALGAIAGGLFIASLFFKFSLGAIIAILLMLFGKGGLLLLDLGRPERFLKVLARPGKSWISKGAWGLIFFAVVGIVAVAPLIFPNPTWLPWAGAGKILGIAAGLGAAFMMIYDGFFLADSKGVEFWRSAGLPIVFATSAATGGVGALMALAPIGGLAISSGTLAANVTALGAAAVCLYTYVTWAAKGSGGARQSTEILTKGKLFSSFWLGAVTVGIAVPLLISTAALMGAPIPAMIWVLIGLLEIVGVIALRYTILNAGVYSPVI